LIISSVFFVPFPEINPVLSWFLFSLAGKLVFNRVKILVVNPMPSKKPGLGLDTYIVVTQRLFPNIVA